MGNSLMLTAKFLTFSVFRAPMMVLTVSLRWVTFWTPLLHPFPIFFSGWGLHKGLECFSELFFGFLFLTIEFLLREKDTYTTGVHQQGTNKEKTKENDLVSDRHSNDFLYIGLQTDLRQGL